MSTRTVLVARMDSMGDVLLSGPAVRAIARRADRVVVLAGPQGEAAARLLPGVDEVITWCAPWISPQPPRVERQDVEELMAAITATGADEAVVLTSFHQSPLPLALLLRMAGVGRISAISDDYPGSLLDVRHRVPQGMPEAERALSLAEAAGFPPGPEDTGRLDLRRPLPDTRDLVGSEAFTVVHVGADAPARELPDTLGADVVAELGARGHRVVVTGTDRARAGGVGGEHGLNLAGRTTTAELADVLRRARVVTVGNTGPAHLAAAVGTPVVSLFAPVVPASAWAPYGVDHRLLGHQDAPCAGTRARRCPVPGHPCLNGVTAGQVLAAIDELGEAP
ncbi:glycosyltransferase family 9 protein [Nocardiopsis kunsanensis]|uniref:glycosyltransferase family 9 protein n=1 Tax=Nocardiopsis kunsanensis TaxID=141693 RepID=UPI0003456F36|nr:glycosyltransferase family 9 protein [Nocardiopsis kunsanensis]